MQQIGTREKQHLPCCDYAWRLHNFFANVCLMHLKRLFQRLQCPKIEILSSYSHSFVFPKRGALEPSQNLTTVSLKTAVPQRKVSQVHHFCRANSYPRRSTPSSFRSREPSQRNRTLIFGSFLDEPLLVVRLGEFVELAQKLIPID